ncbi:hypothetical protein JCM19000A_07960 [Silvimonas sp. JCM 19000]
MDTLYAGFDLAPLRTAQHWRALAPDLHVADASFWQDAARPLPLSAAALDDLNDLIVHEGYFHAEPMDWQLPVLEMASVIHALRQARIPPVFAYVYDEFWLLFARLQPLCARILGPAYAGMPNFWAWHIDPAAGDSGWQPHRDLGRRALYPDGRPKAITIWLPLTDATPLNGCMYVVPADRDPVYNTADEMQMRYQLGDIRALPARAGSVLAWTQAVLHWGARSAPRHSLPRISLAMEFQRGDEPPFAEFCFDPRRMPDFAERIQLIARQLQRYQHFHRDDAGLAHIAAHLLDAPADNASA